MVGLAGLKADQRTDDLSDADTSQGLRFLYFGTRDRRRKLLPGCTGKERPNSALRGIKPQFRLHRRAWLLSAARHIQPVSSGPTLRRAANGWQVDRL